MKLWKKFKEVTATVTMLKEDETGLFVPNRQLSWIFASVVLFGFLTFITGYFWGQRKAIERFVHKIEEESFADRISYALYTMNDKELGDFEDAESDAADTNGIQETDAQEPVLSHESSEKIQIVQNQEIPAACAIPEDIFKNIKEEKEHNEGKIFVAPLAGFGTLHAANAFARRVRKYYSGVQVKTRVSKTPKGKTIAWYQAVTGEFDNRDDIERTIEQIKKHEHIKDINVIERGKVIRT